MGLRGTFSLEFVLNGLPILDPRPLQDLLDLGAGPELVQELIRLLKEDAPARLAGLGHGLAAGDADRVLHEAHQLKGALGNLGLVRFADLARQVEALAQAGDLVGAGRLADGFPAAYTDALAALEAAHPAAQG